MKPLLTTAAALQQLATGTASQAIDTLTSLFLKKTPDVDILVASSDGQDAQRILLMRDGFERDQFVPDHLVRKRREAVGRMASFAARARTPGPLALPRAWHQYKVGKLVAFFAVPGVDDAVTRWVVEVETGVDSRVTFWRTTTSDNKVDLVEFERDRPTPPAYDEQWLEALVEARNHFEEAFRSKIPEVEIALAELDQSALRGWSYEEWLRIISDDQRAFLDAPADKAIRLRGPAGSGKTLTLTLKAVSEALRARESHGDVRILIVTHSWQLASEISDSKDALGLGLLPEIEVYPLLEIASSISPGAAAVGDQYEVIGNDSQSGKQAQLDEILDLLETFLAEDWLTYRGRVSASLRARFDSNEVEDRFALAWDLLLEFGSVIGAGAIFPGAGSVNRYITLERASWMLPLHNRDDMRVVFALYERYMESLDARGLWTSDQILADLLNDLQKNYWNRARRTEGYDLIFVDEFHLFNPLERQVLHHLSRDVSVYPRIFMALDPRQSPSESFIGVASDETRSGSAADTNDHLGGEVTNFELTTVHRYTPQILELIKHVHLEFPTLELGQGWNVDFNAVESKKGDGLSPVIIDSASRSGEEDDIVRAVHDCYPAGTVAIAVVDTRQWQRYSELAGRINGSPKFHVTTVAGRTDLEGMGYRKRGLVVGMAENLAGLQFTTVLVAGVPDLQVGRRSPNESTRLLSLLYLALSRAEDEVRVFVNEDDGGIPEVLQRAVANSLLVRNRGSLV